MAESTVIMNTENLNKQFNVVEYPGNVQDIDKMLKTMGGITTISQVFGGELKRLEIKYRPDNEFCKPLHGDSQQNAGLLLKVKVRRSKKNPHAATTSHIEVLGHCNKIYTCDSLADYQFLPIVRDQESGEGVYVRNEVIPRNVLDMEFFSRPTTHSLCVPYQFARADSVHTNLHRIDSKDDGQSDILGVLQKPIYDSREIIPFSLTEPFPVRPDPVVAKRMKVKYVSDEQLQRVKKLFDEMPCWTRFALLYESGLNPDKLKHITPSLAYLFSNGPWRALYVRYGYDPRKDFNSRYYQTFDLRLSFRTGMAEFVNVHKNTSRTQESDRDTSEANSIAQGRHYPYLEEGKLPRSRQWILRYCDLRLSKVKEMLDKIPTPLAGATCNEKTGWLPPGFDAQVRQIINNSFQETMREYYRKQKQQGTALEEDDEYISDDNEPDKDSDEYDEVTEEDLDVDMDCVKMEHMQIDEEDEDV